MSRPSIQFAGDPALVLAVVFAGILCSTGAPLAASSPEPPPAAAVHAHYVVLGSAGGATVALARAVIDPPYQCPQVIGGSSPLAMVTRRNPHHFPVLVCEAVIGFGQALQIQLADGTLDLPVVRTDPSRIQVFGDTGCDLGSPGESGACAAGTLAEPFASLASAASRDNPDLIVHLGDYNYRGTGSPNLFTQKQDNGVYTQVNEWTYDAGDGTAEEEACEQDPDSGFFSQNAANANHPDVWSAWRDDFFGPAAGLLPLAPWVFVRGNHELCSRAGPGYFYFLDPSSDLTGEQISCPVPDPKAPPIDDEVLAEPYAVGLGSLNVVVLDSANACDFYTQETFLARYEEQMTTIASIVPETGQAWLVSHRPLWGLEEYDADTTTACTADDQWACLNQTLQAALDGALEGTLPPSISLLLAGHMHRFQSVTFPSSSRPPMVIVGNGGVKLETNPPLGTNQASIGGLAANDLSTGATVTVGGQTQNAFGFLSLTLRPDGSWSGIVHNPVEGFILATCGSAQAAAGSVCQLGPGVEP